jgi:predicted metal-binding membrane protein
LLPKFVSEDAAMYHELRKRGASAALEAVLRRDRVIVLAALGALGAIAWAYVLWLAADMQMGGMDMTGFRMIPAGRGLMMPAAAPWASLEFVFVFAMWAVMMVGMMTPSATPMILLYARVGRQAAAQGMPFAPTIWFAAGYLLIWCAFALVATLAQWGLDRMFLLTPMMESASWAFGGTVLVTVGLFQWTPLKDTCLRQCQAPWLFLQRHGGFRRDAVGSLALGARHGAYCVGCCWALMALLFVVGVMNTLWIAALTILILAEKIIPAGRLISRLAGAGIFAAGAWMLAQALQ